MKRLLFLAMLFLAPHIQFPGADHAYPVRPVDAIILLSTGIIVYSSKGFKLTASKFVVAAAFCFLMSIVSTLWGEIYLSSLKLDEISFENERLIYLSLAIQRLISFAICLMGFYLIVSTRLLDNRTLLRFWFYGLAFATMVHLIIYATDSSILIKRAGVSKEGNFGGSYFVMSFFLMWIALREDCSFGKIGMFFSVLGIFLSQSTSALLVLLSLWGIYTLILAPKLNKGLKGLNVASVAILGMSCIIIAIFFGDAINDKLFGVEITSDSFSRYDRLSAIFSGLKMFEASPVLGVGIQGYAFALPMYPDDFLDQFFDWNSRRIANNVYVELLAEQGIIGLAAVSFLLYSIIKPAFKSFNRNALVALGFISVLVSWMAFPTYTVTFHWLGFALLHKIGITNSIRRSI